LLATAGGDGEVLGLRIAVRDARLLEVVDGVEEVLAEAREEVLAQAPVPPQPLAHRLGAGPVEEEGDLFAEGDDGVARASASWRRISRRPSAPRCDSRR
jgi:hypothetical protein